MPLFMDVHRAMYGVTLADIERAHLRDEEAQSRYGVRYLRFFHNSDVGAVFCLAEGPSADACRAVHLEANGMTPDEIIEVEPIVADGFLGRAPTGPTGVALTPEGAVDGGLRTLMFTDIVDSTGLTSELGDEAGLELVERHDRIVRAQLARHAGTEVKHTGDGILAAFVSHGEAVSCAVGVQRDVAARTADPPSPPLRVRIGLNAGEPVARHHDLYGSAVNLCRRVCDRAAAGEILVTQVVRDLTDGGEFGMHHVGVERLKGFGDPIGLYRVGWPRMGPEAHV